MLCSKMQSPLALRRSLSFGRCPYRAGTRRALQIHQSRAPASLKHEPGVILAEGDYVIVHGRFPNIGSPVNWIAADDVRLKDWILVEHWDVIQDEATEQQSKAGIRCSVARSRSKTSA